jgi:hypothetical protein
VHGGWLTFDFFLAGTTTEAAPFNRPKRSDLFIDTLRHMITAPVLTFDKLTTKPPANQVTETPTPF